MYTLEAIDNETHCLGEHADALSARVEQPVNGNMSQEGALIIDIQLVCRGAALQSCATTQYVSCTVETFCEGELAESLHAGVEQLQVDCELPKEWYARKP